MRRQKNRNILRRLSFRPFALSPLRPFAPYAFCFLLSAFCLFSLSSCDKEEMLYNTWNLQSVTKNGKPYTDSVEYNLLTTYTYYYFLYQNVLTVKTFAMDQITTSSDGFYELLSGSRLKMRFTILNKRYELTAKIKKLTKKELHLEYEDKGNTYFLKLYTN
jgi:hypothetical protein